jgi:hypothetical protein
VPEQTPTRWQEKAQKRWPRAVIHGCGQFAVAPMDGVNIHLFDDFFEATDFMAGYPAGRIYDLTEPVRKANVMRLWKIPGDGQDEKN